MYAMYYVSMLRCWQLVRILVGTGHPCLWVGHHRSNASYSAALLDARKCIYMTYLKLFPLERVTRIPAPTP
jgi:hypothetical protein